MRKCLATFATLFSTAVALLSQPALALDKQGSAHGGSVAGSDQGLALSGSILLGAALYNPSYAARPDNTGHALVRLAPHFDFDVIGRHLSIPLDVNVFTNRDASGISKLLPSELDIITGVTSTWALSNALALEGGVRVERDSPIDKGRYSQAYGDARARLLYALTPECPCLKDTLRTGTWSGAVTLGWFFWNPSYAARPDNSGLALFRYGLSSALELANGWLTLGGDVTSFTDRRGAWLVPTEVDASVMLASHLGDVAFALGYERDMPVDRDTLVQQLLMLSASKNFSVF
jgi:hypothetical protein